LGALHILAVIGVARISRGRMVRVIEIRVRLARNSVWILGRDMVRAPNIQLRTLASVGVALS